MAFVFKIDIEERVGSFVVPDISGTYTFDYPYGYGVQTILPEWIAKAEALITAPNGGKHPMLLPGFGGVGTQVQFMPWDFGMGNKGMMSGLWQVQITISGTNDQGVAFNYYAEARKVLIKEAECCVDKLVAKTYNIKLNDVFKQDESRLVATLSVLLTRAKKAIEDCDIISANNLITQIRLNCRCGCNS